VISMQEKNVAPGLSERIAREIIATPALKELILMQMKDIDARTAPGLVKTLLWGDPGISMSFFGALPDAVNWLLELLLELGRQLNGLPEPLLRDMLGQVGAGIDGERLKQLPETYGLLLRRLVIGEGKTPEETRAAVIAAVNSLLQGLDRLTLEFEPRRKEIASSLSRDLGELDTAALARSLRRVGLLAVAAARGPGKKTAGKAPVAATVIGGAAAFLVLRKVLKRVRG